MVREKKKSAGPLTGLLMIVIGIVMLWLNESNNVKNIKTIEEARGALINISSDKVDSANEGKLVSTNGKLVVEDEYLVFRVKDNGSGISSRDLPRVKDKFYKGKNSKSRNGIGLSICDEIVTLHRGILEIKSRENKGTEVIIKIPLDQGED